VTCDTESVIGKWGNPTFLLAGQLEKYGFSRSPFMKIRHSFVAQAMSEDSRSARIECAFEPRSWPNAERLMRFAPYV
jgi:hypothetical protein